MVCEQPLDEEIPEQLVAVSSLLKEDFKIKKMEEKSGKLCGGPHNLDCM